MNKVELAAKVAEQFELSKRQAGMILDAVFGGIINVSSKKGPFRSQSKNRGENSYPGNSGAEVQTSKGFQRNSKVIKNKIAQS